MPKKSSGRQKVSFVATKKIARPHRVSFTTRTGERVTFTAVKKVARPVRVTFYKKRKK